MEVQTTTIIRLKVLFTSHPLKLTFYGVCSWEICPFQDCYQKFPGKVRFQKVESSMRHLVGSFDLPGNLLNRFRLNVASGHGSSFFAVLKIKLLTRA